MARVVLPWVAVVCAAGLGGCVEDGRAPAAGSEPPERPPARTWMSVDSGPPPPPRPVFGGVEPTLAAAPPPAVQGGTLLITRDGAFALASDPERGVVHRVDLAARVARAPVALDRDAEPGRLVEDGDGRVHVALRSGGEVLVVRPSDGAVLARRAPCPAPSGLAWRPADDAVFVACVDGRLVRYPADPDAGDAPLDVTRLAPDLRDVVIDGDRVVVSRFRAAELLVLREGHAPETVSLGAVPSAEPRVAWRTVANPEGGVVVLHQLQATVAVGGSVGAGAVYYTPALSRSSLTYWPLRTSLGLGASGLFVDVAVGPGDRVAMAQAGVFASPRQANSVAGVTGWESVRELHDVAGRLERVVAVAYAPDGTLYAQTRAPSRLVSDGDAPPIPLGGEDTADTGHDLFHLITPSGLACASCHPAGADDGHVWRFSEPGPRRTTSLLGPVLGTEPFHWDGDVAGFAELVEDTMVGRMQLPAITEPQVAALARFVDATRFVPSAPPGDPAAERGAQVFASERAACAGCHAGARMTDGSSADVGTGRAVQVPSLRSVAQRAPYLHDGSAATLRDALALPAHGGFAALTPEEQEDLLAYLATL